MTAGPAACPSCGSVTSPGDNFCESCRAELRPAVTSGAGSGLGTVPRPAAADGVAAGPGAAPAAGCPWCPEAAATPEGYCESCGRKLPSGDDHAQIDLGLLAGVTDRGLRHSRNEDAMALASEQTAHGPAAIAVVCDGVSTSSRADEASRAAVLAAMQVLLAAARTGDDLLAASARSVGAAQQALAGLAGRGGMPGNAPSATFASVVVTGGQVIVCWLGDTRVYWLDARDQAGARQLTSDDSVAQELVARGLLSESQAMASPAGHVVTGWIGADLADAQPHVMTFSPDGPGAVLLCSDGLWNYQPDAAGLAGRALPAALTDPLGAAAELVSFAVGAGGSDNITAVLIPFPPRSDAGPRQIEEIKP